MEGEANINEKGRCAAHTSAQRIRNQIKLLQEQRDRDTRRQRERGRDSGQKEQDEHVCTHERTEDRGKGELKRQTFSCLFHKYLLRQNRSREMREADGRSSVRL